MSKHSDTFLVEGVKNNIQKELLEHYFVCDSKSSYRNLMNAMSGNLEFKGFESYGKELNLESFSWENSGQDRNWWWQIQALPFLTWYIDSWEVMNAEEKSEAFEFCIKSFSNWSSITNEKTPLLWHDHATAFRLRSLSNWVTFVLLKEEKISDDVLNKFLSSIKIHLHFLSEEKNYSKHTNHGFDQALMVYTLSLIWNQYSILKQEGDKAKLRLIDELEFAFTKQGVHKENSPGYQKFMLSRLEQLIRLEKLGDSELNILAKELYSKAKKFLKVISMPNGLLPMIGDTKGNDVGLEKQLTKELVVHDYSESGYCIVEGLIKNDIDFQLIFKCGHESDYHRHDDDLSIHLYYDGEVIFGDGGLGFYQENDEKRLFLRSAEAHTSTYVKQRVAIRKRKLLASTPSIFYDDKNNILIGETSCWGGRLRREIDLNQLNSGVFTIVDTWLIKPEEEKISGCTSFFLPFVEDTQLNLDQIRFKTPAQNLVTIKMGTALEKLTQVPIVEEENVLYSIEYGKFQNVKKVGWEFEIVENNNVSFQIKLGNQDDFLFQIKSVSENIYEGYIENTQKKRLPFQVKVGNKNITNRALIVLHGHGANKNFAKFSSDEWLVICPLDKYGEGGHGSWWLGENGEVFVLDLLQSLIRYLKDVFSFEKLFFWGSSMGGYGAILHGVLAQADAVYAHMPQVKLRGTNYTDGNNAKFYKPMLSSSHVLNYYYDDLSKYLLRINNKNMPVIFLSQNVFDYHKYIKQHFYPLLDVLDAKSSAFQVEMNLSKGHKLFKSIAQAVEMFTNNSSNIANWRNFQDIDASDELKNYSDFLKKELQMIEFLLVDTSEGLELRASGISEGYLYACYVYKNRKLHQKIFYQNSANFLLSIKSAENLSIRYFVWDKKYDVKVSRDYTF